MGRQLQRRDRSWPLGKAAPTGAGWRPALHNIVFLLIAVAVGTVDVLSLMTVYRWQGSTNSIGNTGFGILAALIALLLVKLFLNPQKSLLWLDLALRFQVVSLYAGTSLVAFYLGDAFPDRVEDRSQELIADRERAAAHLQAAAAKTVELQRAQAQVSVNVYSGLIDAEERQGGCGTKCRQFKPRLQLARDELKGIRESVDVLAFQLPKPFAELDSGKREAFNDALAAADRHLRAAADALSARRESVSNARPMALTDGDLTVEVRQRLKQDIQGIAASLPLVPTTVTLERLGTADEPKLAGAQLLDYARAKPYTLILLFLLYIDLFTAWLTRREASRQRPAVAGEAEVFAHWCIRRGHGRVTGAATLVEALNQGPEPTAARTHRWTAGPGLPPLRMGPDNQGRALLLRHVLPLLEEYAEEHHGNRAYFGVLVQMRQNTCLIDRALLPLLRHPKVLRAVFDDAPQPVLARPPARQLPVPTSPAAHALPDLRVLGGDGDAVLTDAQHLAIAEELDAIPLAVQRTQADRIIAFHLMAARQASHAARLAQVRKHLAALRHLSEADPEIRHTFGPDLLEANIVEANARGDLLQFDSAAHELAATAAKSNRDNAGTSWFKAASSIGHLWLLGGRSDKATKYLNKAIRGLVGSDRIQPLIHRMDATVRAGGPEDSFHLDLLEVGRLLTYKEPSARRAADAHRFLQLLLCRAAATRPHWLKAAEFDSKQAENCLCREGDCHYAAELTGFYLAHAHIQRGHVPEALRVARQLAEHLMALLRARSDEGSPLNLIDVLRLGMLGGVIALVEQFSSEEPNDLRVAARRTLGPHERDGALADTERRQLTEVWQALQAWLGPEAAGDATELHQIINRTGYLWWPTT